MKNSLIIVFLLTCCLLNSCTDPPAAITRNVFELERNSYPDKVVIIADAGKGYGENFRNIFVDKLADLTQHRHKQVAIMTYIEFVHSPYNDPEVKSSFPDYLFVFIHVNSSQSRQGSVYNVKYLIQVKHLDQNPILIQEISLGLGGLLVDSVQQRGEELANTVFEELSKRNIL